MSQDGLRMVPISAKGTNVRVDTQPKVLERLVLTVLSTVRAVGLEPTVGEPTRS